MDDGVEVTGPEFAQVADALLYLATHLAKLPCEKGCGPGTGKVCAPCLARTILYRIHEKHEMSRMWETAEDRCQICNKWLGLGLRFLHVHYCEAHQPKERTHGPDPA